MTDRNNAPDDNRARLKDAVIAVAMKAFHTEGIKSVTMDDIAHRLTMSKRTLYQLFSDKEALLLACIVKHRDDGRRIIESQPILADNILERLLAAFALKMQEMDGITPSFFEEIAKYPRVMAHFREERAGAEAEAVAFLSKGIEQGYFRPDVNFNIVCNYLFNGIDRMFADRYYESFSQRVIFMNTVITYIRGCATLKGIEMIDAFIEKYKTQLHG